MQATADYGPDNPRDWNASHPALSSPLAPHETAGVLRLNRAGYLGTEIMELTGMRATVLVAALQQAMEDENEAHRQGRPIHDSLIEEEKSAEG